MGADEAIYKKACPKSGRLVYISLFFLRSNGALYLAGAQATGADIDAFHFSVHYGANSLNIWVPAAFCL